MKNPPWTEQENAVLRLPISNAEASKRTGRTVFACLNQRRALRLAGKSTDKPEAVFAPATLEEDLHKKDEAYWQERYGSLNCKYEKLLEAETAIERLVSRVLEAAPKSYSPLPRVYQSPRQNSGKAQSALLQFSDTHIGKVTSPAQTLSFGNYNFEIFMARLKYLEESIISIVENHVNTEVPELVVAMLGDMLDGALSHSNEASQLDPVFNQYFCGAHAIAQFLRNLSPYFPEVRIYDVVGNHTRMQNQKRMPTKNRHSNFDKFLYALVQALVRDIPNIRWTLDSQPYQVFDVQGFTFFSAHGDTLRGGDKTLGVPNHAIGRLVSTATQMMNKYGKKAPNYYLLGHLHRDIVLPHATGSILVNGGFPGVDEFGLSEMFPPADPSQKFYFIHPQYGKTASYDISLKFAEVGAPAYTVPEEFKMH